MNEPAFGILEEEFVYKGYKCAVVFQPMCFRCGYVFLPKGHPLHGTKYAKLMRIECHGGLTYSDHFFFGEKKEDWIIGFDCGHFRDGYDLKKGVELFSADYPEFGHYLEERDKLGLEKIFGEARTLEYVKKNCMDIVDQIIKEAK